MVIETKKPGKKVNTNKNWTAWRPNKIDEIVLAKLEEGFMMSLTDDECCLYADINPSTLYRYIEKNPEFSKRKELLKRTPNIKAKVKLVWQKLSKEITQVLKNGLKEEIKNTLVQGKK